MALTPLEAWFINALSLPPVNVTGVLMECDEFAPVRIDKPLNSLRPGPTDGANKRKAADESNTHR